ncbi:ABC transporter permease [Streptomyces sp. NPDC048415]|uniref:ABC transporter permease n=1 Tax=Streptomyces sp. NPDC048415 TaxID=3154822 RepID=UPI003446CF96
MTAVTLPTSVAPPTALTLQAGLFGNEVTKGLRLAWRRRGMVVVGMLLGALNYLGISLFIGGGHLVKEMMVLTLPGLLAVVVAQTASIQGSGGIAEEVNGGTLEQTQLGPAPPQLQVLGRIAALAVEGVAAAALLAVVFAAGFGLDFTWHAAALVPAVLTLLDALGYGLLIIALTVRVAGIGAITHVFNMVIMIFGGMLVPVTVFPAGIETFSHFVPTALGVQALNATLADGSLATPWSDGTLPWLLIHTAASLTAGLAIYVRNIRRARREGGLSPR